MGLDSLFCRDKLKRLAKVLKLTETSNITWWILGALVDTAVAKRVGIGFIERWTSYFERIRVLHVSWVSEAAHENEPRLASLVVTVA